MNARRCPHGESDRRRSELLHPWLLAHGQDDGWEFPSDLMIDVPVNERGHLVTAVYDWNSGKAGALEVSLGEGK